MAIKAFVARVLYTILTIAVFGAPFASTVNAQDQSFAARVDTLAAKEIRRQGLPSFQMAIADEGAIVYSGAYGQADIEAKTPATNQTQYRIASISKWLTGTATMTLVDKNKLDLDAPIQTYCPAFPKKEWQITTRQLLSHTSGVRHYTDTEQETPSTVHYDDVIAPLETFKDDALLFEPAMGWAYSSHGYRLLGCVIQGAAKMPYSDYIKAVIFDPVAMTRTQPEGIPGANPQQATNYSFVRKRKLRVSEVRDISENLPAGGHVSTATDIALFAQAFDQDKLITPQSRAIMMSLPVARTGTVIESGYGHGVDFMGRFDNTPGHGGSQRGATSLVLLFPEENLSIAVMSNAAGWTNQQKFVQEVLDLYRAK
ncbi:MAG: serine hydrolase domain-containing protein [Pseudomonadota bacterium]